MKKGASTPNSPRFPKKSPGTTFDPGTRQSNVNNKLSPPSAIFSFAASTTSLLSATLRSGGAKSRGPSLTPEPFRPHLNSFTPLVDAVRLLQIQNDSMPDQEVGKEEESSGIQPSNSQRATHDFESIINDGDHRHIKSFVRANQWPVNHPIRAKVWLALCNMTGNVIPDDYDEIVKEIFSDIKTGDPDSIPIPNYIDTSFMLHYHLNTEGKFAVKRIVSVIEYTRPDITYAPQIYFLASLFLHYMPEQDTYASICHLLSAHRAFFIFQTKTSFAASGLVLAELAARFAPSAHTYLASEIARHVNSVRNGSTKKHAFRLILVGSTFRSSVKRDDSAAAAVLEGVYAHWLHWIFRDLPFPYLVRIVDCYLAEGCKVLYRVALALLMLFRKQNGGPTALSHILEERARETEVFTDPPEAHGSQGFSVQGKLCKNISTIHESKVANPSSQKSCENIIGSRSKTFSAPTHSGLHSQSLALLSPGSKENLNLIGGKTRHTSINSNESSNQYQNLSVFISAFCQSAQFSPHKLLKVAFGIRGLSSGILRELTSKNENFVRNRAAPIILSASSASLSAMAGGGSAGSDDLNGHQKNTIAKHRSTLTSTHPAPPFRDSQVLTRDHFRTLWSWIPARFTVYAPAILFSTQEQGVSLKTFFNRVDGEEPTILLIKTTQNYVFGAYCSTDWKGRNARDARPSTPDGLGSAYVPRRTSYNITGNFFGTGETFVFTLAPELKKYPWIGTYSTDPEALNFNMFQSASANRILIGGGGKGHSIQLNESLEEGSTEECDTFANPPLASNHLFSIKILEVIGFK